jgi:TonB family protein
LFRSSFGGGTPIAANLFWMNQIALPRDSDAHIPQQRHVYAIAWVIYALVFVAAIALIKPHPVRMNPAGATHIGIGAFNPGPVGAAGTSQPKPAPTQPVKNAAPSQVTRATALSKDQTDNSSQGSGAPAGAQGVGSGSGPVNLGTGAGLTLLKKVTPTYPRLMEQARMVGTVVLDAVIHRDGTIGDITLKSATNDSFARAAVEAVKQWRYSSIPYEGIVTVTVNFNLPH